MSDATVSSPPREIADGIWWLPECLRIPLSGVETHLHTAPFLIIGSDATLLWDTSTPTHWPTMSERLETLLGDRTLDYIVPSHPEVAHCGNTHRLLQKYPAARLTGDTRDYPLFWPEFVDRMDRKAHGEVIDLGSHRFRLLDATIKDLPSTQWGYEETEQVLFVGDGFAYSHRPPLEDDDRPIHLDGECTLFASELGGVPGPEQIVWITRAALYWTSFVKLDIFLDSFKAIMSQYPVRLVAPAHGAVIDDVDSMLWTIWEALNLSYDPDAGVDRARHDFRKAPTT